MIENKERRAGIIEILKNSPKAISGGELGKNFGVSRQVIVQDIALLKAKGHLIVSTNRGYKLLIEEGHSRTFKVLHSDNDIARELYAIVDLGAEVKDVFIRHRAYGLIKADLNIKSRRDVDKLIAEIKSGVSSPLKNLTKSYHYHTISANSEEVLDEVEDILRDLGFLVEKH
ncbi:transcription repressor NadR [Anaerosphaera multitolerans]|uniref:Transcription repressor NadR n=1 Tax=Anaerosphaera multitolerans TaxID=2487351 RepID=A0A437S5H7_9FIRM|nr:transcription repressor NadR [Anaerosphaera multitolerans]RVU54302.1 transcription repressor NadR [Anaerosphaera multitolerans]